MWIKVILRLKKCRIWFGTSSRSNSRLIKKTETKSSIQVPRYVTSHGRLVYMSSKTEKKMKEIEIRSLRMARYSTEVTMMDWSKKQIQIGIRRQSWGERSVGNGDEVYINDIFREVVVLKRDEGEKKRDKLFIQQAAVCPCALWCCLITALGDSVLGRRFLFIIPSFRSDSGRLRLFLRKYKLQALHSTPPSPFRRHNVVSRVLQLEHIEF